MYSFSAVQIHFDSSSLCMRVGALIYVCDYREDMLKTLEANTKGLEDYAKLMEKKSSYVVSLLQPMFLIYKVELPAPPEPQPISSYPLDLASAHERVERIQSKNSPEEPVLLPIEDDANPKRKAKQHSPSATRDSPLTGLEW